MNYKIKDEYKDHSPKDLVKLMLEKLNDIPLVPSVEGNKPYYINKVTAEEVSFTSPERNNGDPETIHRVHFTPVFRVFLKADSFNLKSHKEHFQSAINKKRPATIALMLAAGLVNEVDEVLE
ncbi:hypothetical protein GC194_12730 [bacterium]|nr:hypothetical protein [bacterium]